MRCEGGPRAVRVVVVRVVIVRVVRVVVQVVPERLGKPGMPVRPSPGPAKSCCHPICIPVVLWTPPLTLTRCDLPRLCFLSVQRCCLIRTRGRSSTMERIRSMPSKTSSVNKATGFPGDSRSAAAAAAANSSTSAGDFSKVQHVLSTWVELYSADLQFFLEPLNCCMYCRVFIIVLGSGDTHRESQRGAPLSENEAFSVRRRRRLRPSPPTPL